MDVVLKLLFILGVTASAFGVALVIAALIDSGAITWPGRRGKGG